MDLSLYYKPLMAPEYCIIGTNTSSLSIAELAQSTSDPSRVIGMHFFNPVHIINIGIMFVPEMTGNDVITATKLHNL